MLRIDMTQPESRISKAILTHLRKQGHFAFKIWGNDHMMVGLPDIIACVHGYFVGFETKMPDKRDNVSPKQTYVHSLIERAGGRVWVVCSVAEVQNHINNIPSQRSIID